MTLQDLAGISSNLLNFQSSIEAESKRAAAAEAERRRRATAEAERKRIAAQKRKARIAAQKRKARIKAKKSSILYAVLSCEHSNRHTNIAACFVGAVKSEIKLTNKGRTRIYKSWELHSLGKEYNDGLRFELSKKFSFVARNSSKNLTLRLVIRDNRRKIVFQDVAGQYHFIKVKN